CISCWAASSLALREASQFESRVSNPRSAVIPITFQTNLILPSFQPRGSVSLCYLPTCMNANLGSALQKGDEIAGASTNDPHGIGRK
uniref:Uncharacterized protein n=1 Tax=Oncorhynchus tshawytscha TaxID=74940 RepID=A0A8C8MJE6_ONCTS